MDKLTQQEEDLMQAIWSIGEANIKTYLDTMQTPPPYTTLASTIKNLDKKGYVTNKKIGNTYLYKATITEEKYKKTHVQGFINNYFDNSYKNLVSFFAKEKKLSVKDLKEIINQIEKGI